MQNIVRRAWRSVGSLGVARLISSVPERLFDDGNFFLALNLNSASFPGRNSGLPRRSTSVASSPSWKLQASIYLANVSLSASYLLLLAGDVSSKPGPVKDPCTICSKGCRSNQRAIQCDGCDKWHHATYLNMGADEYYPLATDTDESSTWMCFTCLFPGINCWPWMILIAVLLLPSNSQTITISILTFACYGVSRLLI